MRIVILPFALLLVGTAHAASTTQYTVLFQDKPGGAQTVEVAADGRITVDYSFRDNGRGPDYREEIVLAPDGTQTSHRVTGKSMFGAPADESYTRNGTAAQWKTVSDSGSATPAGPAAYVPIESAPESLAILARAALARPGGRLAVLPVGEIGVARIAQHRVAAGGNERGVSLYALTGLELRPAFIWLSDDAAGRTFAYVYPGWMQMVEAGWEPVARQLEQWQQESEAEWLGKLAQRLTHRLPEPILIRNARVFDAEAARLGAPSDVYINGGRIAALMEAGSKAQDAATVIDAGGRTLLPALFDMHGHEGPWNAALQLAGGVTTVRDMGADNGVLASLMQRIDSGQTLGARIVPAGYIEGESEFASRGGFVVADVAAARQAIDWYAQRGVQQIKLYNSIRPEWVKPIAEHAHRRGLRVSGHIPAFMRAEQAVRDGFDEITHINQLMLNFLAGPKDDTRTLARFYLILDKAHALDLHSPQANAFIALLQKKGTVVDPTLAVFSDMAQRQGETNPTFAAIAGHLPAAMQRSLKKSSFDVTEANIERYQASVAKLSAMVGRLHRAGIPLVAGTDSYAGFTLHRELELYVEAGIPAAKALQIATRDGARYSGMLERLGTIERGKLADLILVDGDPTKDISSIRRVALTMKEGVAYYPSEIYEAMGVKPFAEPVRPVK